MLAYGRGRWAVSLKGIMIGISSAIWRFWWIGKERNKKGKQLRERTFSLSSPFPPLPSLLTPQEGLIFSLVMNKFRF